MLAHSPPPHIKSEPSNTPKEGTPARRLNSVSRASSIPDPSIDPDTLKALTALKNEHGLRGSRRERSTPVVEAPKPEPKKRPAPKSSKKGTATAVRKPPPKKRRLETDSTGAATPSSATRRSATPSSRVSRTPGLANGGRKKSQSGTPVGHSSPTPFDHATQSDVDEDASSADEGADLFCICRKPDNHKWMIACDGGCEDWFHGKCVAIREEDGNLIDKYICPGCEANGRGVTTWKPMCRRPGCRKPARLAKGRPSKYCSDTCGHEFFQDALSLAREKQTVAAAAARKRKETSRRKTGRAHGSPGSEDDDRDSMDVDVGPRGGAIRPAEVKALATSVPDVASFRRLGDRDGIGVSPSAAPGTSDALDPALSLNASETARLANIAEARAALRVRRALLRDRERFVTVVRDNVAKYAETEDVKAKDVCGFDTRLSWNEQEFARWRLGKEGREVLGQADEIDGRACDAVAGASEGAAGVQSNAADGAQSLVDAPAPVPDATTIPTAQPNDTDLPDADGNTTHPSTMCTRKRCERHKQWQKLAVQDVRFEEADVVGEIRRLEAEEKDIRERAMVRWREERGAAGSEGEDVQVVDVDGDGDGDGGEGAMEGVVHARQRSLSVADIGGDDDEDVDMA